MALAICIPLHTPTHNTPFHPNDGVAGDWGSGFLQTSTGCLGVLGGLRGDIATSLEFHLNLWTRHANAMLGPRKLHTHKNDMTMVHKV